MGRIKEALDDCAKILLAVSAQSVSCSWLPPFERIVFLQLSEIMLLTLSKLCWQDGSNSKAKTRREKLYKVLIEKEDFEEALVGVVTLSASHGHPPFASQRNNQIYSVVDTSNRGGPRWL